MFVRDSRTADLSEEATMLVRRSVIVLAFAAVASVLLASSAWAWCSPYYDTTTSLTVSPNAAAAGTEVQVYGQHWAPGYVEVRWDSASGPLLGASWVTLPIVDFRLKATIPAGADSSRSHNLVAIHREAPPQPGAVPPADESLPRGAFAPFQVLASSGSPVTTPPPAGSLTGTANGGQASNGAGAPAPLTGSTGITGQGTNPSPSAQGAPVPAAAGNATTPSRPSDPARAPSGLAALVSAAPAPSAAPVAQDEAAAASPASALGELWQGFETGRNPSTASGLNNLPATRDPLQQATSLLVLLPLGVLTLGAGFGAAELRRRRVLAAG